MIPENQYIDREKSWLAFNARVLQEAGDENVPLLDRLRFLGIFSNNSDEFFRVRYSAVRRLAISGIAGEKLLGGSTSFQLLKDITTTAIRQQSESLRILSVIERELEKENIFMVDETELSEEQEAFIREFFIQKVSPALVTIILNDLAEFPLLKDTSGYLAVKMVLKATEKTVVAGFPQDESGSAICRHRNSNHHQPLCRIATGRRQAVRDVVG
ncbi:hypothetical protein [Flavobacterium sp. N1718]|uniref:hypothetical protein n=1 Tax=Flavobacterium sp. N1718 TaxID=2986822 RepID=UPI0039B51C37